MSRLVTLTFIPTGKFKVLSTIIENFKSNLNCRGSAQPGCGVDLAGNCAHSRAHELFAESIVLNRFVATQCTGGHTQIVNRNCQGTIRASMGGDVWSHGARGVFYLETNSNTPFARG